MQLLVIYLYGVKSRREGYGSQSKEKEEIHMNAKHKGLVTRLSTPDATLTLIVQYIANLVAPDSFGKRPKHKFSGAVFR